jgi:P-type E1-E2 ATPase
VAVPPPPTDLTGLSQGDVAQRRAAGLVNIQPERSSRSIGGIVRANVLTRFNAIIAVLAAVVLVVGSPIDAIFALIMVINAAIGVVQELRAKRTIDRLRILIAPMIEVVRDGRAELVAAAELVTDDVIHLRPGDQVPVDGLVVVADGLEVDESALTGEADAVAKPAGAEVRSGSFIVAGSATVRATAVGESTWIHQLLVQAKEFRLATSELRRGVDRILRVVAWGIAPIAALLLWSQLRDQPDVGAGLVSAVAGVVGLVPQGLVLLVSMALAVAVVRLARLSVVVQDLHAVEGLARVDVVCLDKTGTLTTGAMTLDRIEPIVAGIDAGAVLAALVSAEPTPNATLRAAAGEAIAPDWSVAGRVPFSSARKWSGATFTPGGTWIVGAPEVVLGAVGAGEHEARRTVARHLADLAEDARRLLLLARSATTFSGQGAADPQLPDDLEPVALVVVAEQVRSDAAATLRYFAEQHVVVKIISGDNPVAVSTIARRLGVPGADRHVDLRDVDLSDPADAATVAEATVFGRVLPQQKRQLVEALQAHGHTVAMTGDGVNDIPALKKADIAIAMDTATPATKAISQLVLLDGRFDRLPEVVAEGRRVITNMERVSALFVTKTVYSAVFAVAVGIWGVTFPFLPRHLSLISETTIGIPAFALSFRSADRPYRPGYLRRVMRFSAPAGIATATIVLISYAMVRAIPVGVSTDEARTTSTIVLLVVALWVLYLLMKPVDRFDALVLGGMVALAALATLSPWGRTLYAIDWPAPAVVALIAAYLATAGLAATLTMRLIRFGTADRNEPAESRRRHSR